MSTSPVTLDFSKAQPVPQEQPQQPVQLDFSKAQSLEEGQQVNDVGNTIIVPKEGESYQDTIKRAVEHYKAMPKAELQERINREEARMPSKIGQTLAAAPAIGAGGSAILSLPGEVLGTARAVLPKVIPATIAGVKAIGEWAESHPTQARILYYVIRDTAVGAAAIKAIKEYPLPK